MNKNGIAIATIIFSVALILATYAEPVVITAFAGNHIVWVIALILVALYNAVAGMKEHRYEWVIKTIIVDVVFVLAVVFECPLKALVLIQVARACLTTGIQVKAKLNVKG